MITTGIILGSVCSLDCVEFTKESRSKSSFFHTTEIPMIGWKPESDTSSDLQDLHKEKTRKLKMITLYTIGGLSFASSLYFFSKRTVAIDNYEEAVLTYESLDDTNVLDAQYSMNLYSTLGYTSVALGFGSTLWGLTFSIPPSPND